MYVIVLISFDVVDFVDCFYIEIHKEKKVTFFRFCVKLKVVQLNV